MRSIFLSICIPSFNRVSELNRLLKSIDCDQSEVEIVICEDLAPKRNEIRNMVNEFARNSFYEINYHENSINQGFDGNLRRLVECANGEYIMYMGDDDIFLPNMIDKFIEFLKKNKDKPYILRSYITKHADGNIEYFKYLPNSQTLPAGVNTVAWLIKRSVTICGFTISRKEALKVATDNLDGTLLYQVYLMARVCLNNESIYYDSPIVQCTQDYRKDNPMFGNSKNEKNLYTPGKVSEDNSINFTKAYFELTSYLDKNYSQNLTKLVLIDLSKYSYPFLSIQRKRGINKFLSYAKRLEKEVGLGCTYYFHLYKWALAFLGEKICDKIIILIKRVVGHTPNL